MEHRWYKIWPIWVPKDLEFSTPVSEYIREWAAIRPDSIAISFYGFDIAATTNLLTPGTKKITLHEDKLEDNLA